MFESLGMMFSIGLLGSLHCIGMCGGLVGALALGRPAIWWSGLFIYQLGRVTTYALFGLLVGLVGVSLSELGGTLLQ
ncbi:MAG TPA: sulfite exporter TauE/SafE family protein, partial [Mariprofundaceae bacterium]|nr:sulfite exporter TauE/SafE family protein [Mariprofundaceae bacterium]